MHITSIAASREGRVPVSLVAGAIIVCGGAYGASIGAWHSSQLAFYCAVKVPLLLLSTAAVTSLFNWIIAALLGVQLRFAHTFALTVQPLAIAAVIVGSLAPVTLFLSVTLPPPDESQRTLHNLLYLLHMTIIAAAGLSGTSMQRSVLIEVCEGDTRLASRVHVTWNVAYAFVAGEVAWMLRPFVGSVYLPVVFVRPDALRGNVYEFIFTDILPHLIRRLTG